MQSLAAGPPPQLPLSPQTLSKAPSQAPSPHPSAQREAADSQRQEHAAWRRVCAGRASVVALVLVPPDLLLARSAWVNPLPHKAGPGLPELLLQAWAAMPSRTVLAALLQQAQPWRRAASDQGLDLATTDCLRAPDPHDAYFRIARSAPGLADGSADGLAVEAPACPSAILVDSLLASLALFVDETPAASEFHDYAVIGDALLAACISAVGADRRLTVACLGRHHTQTPNADLATQPPSAPTPLQMRAPDPVRRWLRGHQLFAALSQGLVITLQQLQQANAQGDAAGVERALLQVALLYDASAAAFRFTADFDPVVYATTIRPSMCEPYTPKGFSGTLSVDHGVLVRQLVALRGPLATAQQQHPLAYQRMRAAIERVYADHKWVCARFDGASVPSLRTSSHAGESTAVDMLDRFRSRRMGLLP